MGLPKQRICVAYVRVLSLKTMFLEVLGLAKLSICVVVLGRMPICAVSASEIVFRGPGLAEAEFFVSSSLADCLFALSLPLKLCLEVLGLLTLSICVVVLGRLPICDFSAPGLF